MIPQARHERQAETEEHPNPDFSRTRRSVTECGAARMIPLIAFAISVRLRGSTSIFSAVHFAFPRSSLTTAKCQLRKSGLHARLTERFIRRGPAFRHVAPDSHHFVRRLRYRRRVGARQFATDGTLPKTRGEAHVSNTSLRPAESVRLINGRRVCDSVRNLWLHPEVFGKPRTRLAESVANYRAPTRRDGGYRLRSDRKSG